MELQPGSRRKTLFFAQLSGFSGGNASLRQGLSTHLDDYDIVCFDVWRHLVSRPYWLALLVAGVVRDYGLAPLRSRDSLIKHIMSSALFFDLASWTVRRKAREIPSVVAIFQTLGLFNAKLPGLPLILYVDDVILRSDPGAGEHLLPPERLVARERRLFDEAAHIATAGSHAARSLVENYGLSSDKVHVVFAGANASPSAPMAADRYGRRRILFVGVEWERKGGPELIRAFDDVLKTFSDARLSIAGCTPDIVHPNVDVLGRRPLDEIAALYGDHSIFCLPSRYEPFGFAAVEASLAGLPVVGGNGGGFLDTIVDGETGFRASAGDWRSLADRLTRLLADPDMCRRFGEAGRLRAEGLMTWPIVTGKVAALIRGEAIGAAELREEVAAL